MKRPKLKELAYMLGVYSNKTIPQTYIGEFSNYELLLTLLQKINEIIERCNLYNDAINEISKLLDDLETEIKAEVTRILNEMYDNGEFDEILKEFAEDFLETYLNDRPLNSALNFRRVHRGLYNIGDNDRYYTLAIRPCHMQGATYVNYNGIDYYVYCLMFYGINTDWHLNTGVILAYDVATGLCAGGVAVAMQHMNSMDYNPKDQFLYVAGCWVYESPSDEDGSPSSMIYRIHMGEIVDVDKGGLNKDFINNLNTYAVPDTLKLCDEGLAYHPSYPSANYSARDMRELNDNPYLVWNPEHPTNHISYSNDLPANQIYIGTKRGLLYIYDWENNTIIDQIGSSSLNIKLYDVYGSATAQSGCVCGDYYYLILYNPSCIVRCNLKTQEIEYTYELEQIVDNGYWVAGEWEDLKVRDNGDLYIFTSLNVFQGHMTQFKLGQVFKSNVFYNTICHDVPDKKEPLVIFVNRFTHNNNPDGRPNNVSGTAFKTIFEAVCFANNNNVADVINIEMETSSVYGIEISTPKKIFIRRLESLYGEYTDLGNQEKSAIGGILCSGAGNVVLTLLDIHNSYPTNHLPFNAYLRFWQSHVVMDNVFISRNDESIQTAIQCYSGTLSMSGKYSVANGNFTVESEHTSGDNGIEWGGSTFIDSGDSIINAHNWATRNTNVIA